MKVLANWNEIGSSVNGLKEAGLPMHNDPPKCWDFTNIRDLLLRNNIPSKACIVDLGCGPSMYGSITLEFLHAMGYENLTGVDLFVPMYARLGALIRGWFKFHKLTPYRLIVDDITSTRFEKNSVDVVILLSVVEHGVDSDKLFCELSRILKDGGIIYLSTDYWESTIEMVPRLAASGARDNQPLPWQIYDPASLNDLIELAKKYGFKESCGGEVSPCQDKTVYWQGVGYTFVALEFKKSGNA